MPATDSHVQITYLTSTHILSHSHSRNNVRTVRRAAPTTSADLTRSPQQVVVGNAFAAANAKLMARVARIFTLLDELYLASPSAFSVSTDYLKAVGALCLRDTSAAAWPVQAAATLAGMQSLVLFTQQEQLSCKYIADPLAQTWG